MSVRGDDASAEAVDGFPRGGNLVGHVVFEGGVVLLLRSTEMLDQPAGLRGLVFIPTFLTGVPVFLTSPLLDMVNAKDEVELTARFEALSRSPEDSQSRTPSAEASDKRMKVLRSAAAGMQGLAGALAASGAEIEIVYQRAFVKHLRHLSKDNANTPALDAWISDAFADEWNLALCAGDWCELHRGDAPLVEVQFTEENDQPRIRRIVAHGLPPSPPPHPRTPRVVSPSPSHTGTEAVVREVSRVRHEYFVEAPLGGDGIVGLAREVDDQTGFRIVIRDGAFVQIYQTSIVNDSNAPETRFADLDGDGRTDIIVENQGAASPSERWYYAFITPRTVNVLDPKDAGAIGAMLDSKNIDDALRAAMRVPSRGASSKDLRQIVARMGRPPSLSGVLAPGGVEVVYDWSYPGPCHSHDHRHRLDPKAYEQVRYAAERAYCSTSRPVCTYGLAREPDYFWLSWDTQGRPSLSGVALYKRR